jgi:hypothetical protein
VNQPCVVLLHHISNTELQISVSCPLNAVNSVAVEVSLELSGPGAAWDALQGSSALGFALPTGENRGKSVTQTYTILSEGRVNFPPVAPTGCNPT